MSRRRRGAAASPAPPLSLRRNSRGGRRVPQDEWEDDGYCRDNGLAPREWDEDRVAYPAEDRRNPERRDGFREGTCGFAAAEGDEQWAICCCVDDMWCCPWGEDDPACMSRDDFDWEWDEEEEEREEDIAEDLDAMRTQLDESDEKLDAVIAFGVLTFVVSLASLGFLIQQKLANRDPTRLGVTGVEMPDVYNELTLPRGVGV